MRASVESSVQISSSAGLPGRIRTQTTMFCAFPSSAELAGRRFFGVERVAMELLLSRAVSKPRSVLSASDAAMEGRPNTSCRKSSASESMEKDDEAVDVSGSSVDLRAFFAALGVEAFFVGDFFLLFSSRGIEGTRGNEGLSASSGVP